MLLAANDWNCVSCRRVRDIFREGHAISGTLMPELIVKNVTDVFCFSELA